MLKPNIISFDIGNTLLNLNTDKGFCTYFCEQIGVELSEIREILNRYFLCTNDTIDVAVEKVCEFVGLGSPQKIIEGFKPSKALLFDDVIPTLMVLKANGLKIIAFSNCSPWEANGLDEYGLSDFIDKVYYSHNIGVAKPDIRAFRCVQEDMGAQANEILHIGDSLDADVKGALLAGWNAYLLNRTFKVYKEELYKNITEIYSMRDLIKLLGYAT